MILRRVIKHVKNQEWTAIGLDFLIVVVGVFVGLQVNTWNEARVQEQTARVYIERIREDLAGNQEDMVQRALYFTQTRDHGLAALAALDQPPETLGEEFLIDVYQASQIIPRTFGRDTYDEILSVGAVNAITDVSLRKMLANFYRGVEAPLAIVGQTVPYREIVREKLPYAAQVAIRANCEEVSVINSAGEPRISLPETCEIDLAPDEISQSVSAIIDADIHGPLVRRLSDLDNKILMARRLIARVQALDSHLEEQQQ
ncbi:hypothetical protein [Hyphomonas johnsonii]|uniref:Uncharacterized protein n=1 Tax=Hyphomonas johnsonii MHS-2 TaxID=1280950 RepID=A0A059FJP5_9PROT|nr:hypothetical protein [Hyphomonas johnsonii]KCZ90854.1 hypothetical protein HJO_13421 [Hyphomonas johnsonii MHS-2]